MTRVLVGIIVGLAIACLVLGLMLRSKSAQVALLEQRMAVKDALMEQAASNARSTLAYLDAERAIRKAQAREIDLLHAQLDTIARNRPNFSGRPRTSDPARLRDSILRATRQ